MVYRQLTQEEILQLKEQSCDSKNWSGILVDKDFDVKRIHYVNFSGSIKIGKLSGEIRDHNGVVRPCGLYYTSLHEVNIGNDVLISNVGIVSNYTIEDEALLQNVNELVVSGETSFGNGTEIEVLNEGGGRELIIFDKLNAQIAYIIVVYRHRPLLVSSLKKIIFQYCKTKTGKIGLIGRGSRILNCNTINNVNIGQNVVIQGTNLLKEGTIHGDPDESTSIGNGVIASYFIMLSGSSIKSSALIDHCFIGQGVRIGKQFSAENSAFFANCEGFHGEAVSLFAGPYTVTHHKSTLLIAGLFSFYNAGSGTNQSNHMYKLGPIHQGIVERGSKTGSFSYLLWPSKVGPFSVVMDKHGSNFDASDLPFSYITIENGKTMLTPAMNLLTVGTKRDTEKWPKRDRRKGSEKLDMIHFELFNPYVIGKVLNGIDILNHLYEKTPKEQEFVTYKGVRIKRLMLKSCRKYYEMAWNIFLGERLLKRLESGSVLQNLKDIRQSLISDRAITDERWVDMAGLIAPVEIVDKLLIKIEENSDLTLDDICTSIQEIYETYDQYAWAWAQFILKNKFNLETSHLSKVDVINMIDQWKTNYIRLNNMILSDAKKEFDTNSQISFGHDGLEDEIKQDFEHVRGSFEKNSFVMGMQKDISVIERTAEEWINKIEKVN